MRKEVARISIHRRIDYRLPRRVADKALYMSRNSERGIAACILHWISAGSSRRPSDERNLQALGMVYRPRFTTAGECRSLARHDIEATKERPEPMVYLYVSRHRCCFGPSSKAMHSSSVCLVSHVTEQLIYRLTSLPALRNEATPSHWVSDAHIPLTRPMWPLQRRMDDHLLRAEPGARELEACSCGGDEATTTPASPAARLKGSSPKALAGIRTAPRVMYCKAVPRAAATADSSPYIRILQALRVCAPAKGTRPFLDDARRPRHDVADRPCALADCRAAYSSSVCLSAHTPAAQATTPAMTPATRMELRMMGAVRWTAGWESTRRPSSGMGRRRVCMHLSVPDDNGRR